MSVNTNRKRTDIVTDNRSYKVINLTYFYPPYWDEGIVHYKSRGFRNIKKKRIFAYQYRMYRTWKHNRDNQWQ